VAHPIILKIEECDDIMALSDGRAQAAEQSITAAPMSLDIVIFSWLCSQESDRSADGVTMMQHPA
jgi:hypothetical protein